MKVSDLFLQYINHDDGKHVRKFGRYYASEIYGIMKGYVTPETFFDKKPADLGGARMMMTGMAMETQLNEVFEKTEVDYKYNTKYEMQISDEITLVVKPDFIFKDFVIETKFPFSMFQMCPEGIPQRYLYQLEAEAQATQKPVYLGVFSIPFNVELIPYTASCRRWKGILKTLEKFHEELKVEINK